MQQLNLFQTNFIPDKHTYKTTITNLLRQQIIEIANGLITSHPHTWLEIGCDVCYTTETLEPYFHRLIALDIDQKRIDIAKNRIKSNKIDYIVGTSNDIPKGDYDVVLIDANHEYDFVMNDFENVYDKNQLSNFTVIFHDYGLTESGVKDAVQKIYNDYNFECQLIGEEEDWNPLGGSTFDFEAAKINIRK